MDEARYVDTHVLAAIQAGRGSATDLPTLFERIDSDQRVVFEHGDLDASLRRLSDQGLIRVLGDGSFVDPRRRQDGSPFTGMTTAEYTTGLRAYHEGFAIDAARVMRMRVLRWVAPASVDMDFISIQYEVEAVIASAGGRISRPSIRSGVVRLPIRDLDPETDRGHLAALARGRLAQAGFGERHVVLTFESGRDVAVAGPPSAD